MELRSIAARARALQASPVPSEEGGPERGGESLATSGNGGSLEPAAHGGSRTDREGCPATPFLLTEEELRTIEVGYQMGPPYVATSRRGRAVAACFNEDRAVIQRLVAALRRCQKERGDV